MIAEGGGKPVQKQLTTLRRLYNCQSVGLAFAM
jgi:hypothetical protein